MTVASCLAVLLASLSPPEPVEPLGAETVVVVAIDAPDWSSSFRAELEAEFDLELAGQGLSLCVERQPDACGASIARITLRGGPRGEVAISVDDPLTNKQTTRALDLGDIPEAARSLSLAIATAELLRTSWAELALDHRSTPEPREPIPAPIEASVAETFVQAKPPRPAPEHELTAGFRGTS